MLGYKASYNGSTLTLRFHNYASLPLAVVLAAELQWMLRNSWALCFSARELRVEPVTYDASYSSGGMSFDFAYTKTVCGDLSKLTKNPLFSSATRWCWPPNCSGC